MRNTFDVDDVKLVCPRCMVERDPALAAVVKMPRSWYATWLALDAKWVEAPTIDERCGGIKSEHSS